MRYLNVDRQKQIKYLFVELKYAFSYLLIVFVCNKLISYDCSQIKIGTSHKLSRSINLTLI